MKQLWERVVALAASNLGLKVLALVIALGLWFAGQRDTERAVEVPVEFRNIPADLMVTDNRVDYVVLRLGGPRTLVSTLDAGALKLSLDLEGAKAGAASFPLSSNSFKLPRGVAVARITPPVIQLRLEPVGRRTLPVVVRLTGKPSAGYKIALTAARPESVLVQGPADEVRRLAAAETFPVDIEQSRGAIKQRVRLATNGKPLSFLPDQVEVTVGVEEERIEREFRNVDVRAKGFSGDYSVKPPTVYLRLSGPKLMIDKLRLDSDQVFLDLKGLAPGEHLIGLSFNLAPEIAVVEQRPQRLRVKINKTKG